MPSATTTGTLHRVARHETLIAPIEQLVDELIARLGREPTPEARAAIIEARRLRSVIGTWGAIPPTPEVRRSMLARVMDLAGPAGRSGERIAVRILETNDAPPPLAAPSTPVVVAPPVPPPTTPPRMPATAGVRGPSGLHRIPLGPRVSLVRPEAAPWHPFPMVAGVSVKILFRDHAAGEFTALVRMISGAQIPRHRHASNEEIFVLEGEAVIGTQPIRAGEYCRSEAGSIHDVMIAAEGCVFFLRGSDRDEPLVDG